jgi:hypothetical protein
MKDLAKKINNFVVWGLYLLGVIFIFVGSSIFNVCNEFNVCPINALILIVLGVSSWILAYSHGIFIEVNKK